MKIKELVPFRRKDGEELSRREQSDPFFMFHDRMNRLFDDFMGDFGRFPFWTPTRVRGFAMSPKMDVAEDDKEVVVTAELPGMEEKDVELLLTDDALTIKGEKKMEKEEKERDYHRTERTYGSFHRAIALPAEIDREKATASFKHGVLKVTLPKTATAKKETRKIEIRKE